MSDLTHSGRKERAMRDLIDLMRTDSEIMDEISEQFNQDANSAFGPGTDENVQDGYYYRIMSTVAGLLSQAHAVRPSLRNGR